MDISYQPHPAAERVQAPVAAGLAFAEGLSAACLSSLIDELDVGMLVCSAGGQLAHANVAGHSELRWARLLLLAPGQQVSAAQPAQRAGLLNAIAAAMLGRRQLLLLKCGDERLMLSVQPLAGSAGAKPRVLLLLGRRSVAPGLVVEMLGRMHALTAAEQRVLDGLLHGETVASLAARFGVKVSTVRTQVSALRAKLGVRRVTDALRLAAELPPMAGALRCQQPAPAPAFSGVSANQRALPVAA